MRWLLLMALVFSPQTRPKQVFDVEAGTHRGHIRLTEDGCHFRGRGIGLSTIKLDGTFGSAVQTVAGIPLAECSLYDMTIDVDDRREVGAALEANDNLKHLQLFNVAVRNHRRGTSAVYNRARITAAGLLIAGDGGSIFHSTNGAEPGATSTIIRGAEVIGGQWAFQNTAARGIVLERLRSRHDFWASPRYEAVTATAFAPFYVDVESHVFDHRSIGDILRVLTPVATYDTEDDLTNAATGPDDRIEDAEGNWSQVIGIEPDGRRIVDQWRTAGHWYDRPTPSGLVTVYRVVMGRYYGAIGDGRRRLVLQTGAGAPVGARWRYVNAATAPTPELRPGVRLDIVRIGGPERDADTGAIHITEHAIDARVDLADCSGTASDTITGRGRGTILSGCRAGRGYDMAITLGDPNGRVVARGCVAYSSGRSGIALVSGPSDLYGCEAWNNGTINDGSGDFGVTAQPGSPESLYSTVRVRGGGNLDGLLAPGLVLTEGGFERARPGLRRPRRSW